MSSGSHLMLITKVHMALISNGHKKEMENGGQRTQGTKNEEEENDDEDNDAFIWPLIFVDVCSYWYLG